LLIRNHAGSANPQTVNHAVELNRRSLLTTLAIAASSVCSGRSLLADTENDAPAQRTTAGRDDRFTRVKSVVEIKGNIEIKIAKAAASTASSQTPIESKTNLEFEEVIRTRKDSRDRFAVQLYSQAECVNDVQKYATTTKLRDECKTIVKLIDSQSRSIQCLDNPLTASERDLVQGPISTVFLDTLRPSSAIKLGDQWQVKGEALANLLNIEKVTAGELKVTLVDADSKIGQLEFSGVVEGEIHDIKTSIKIEGKARLDRTTGMISWVAVLLQEKRQVGESEPGFDITARVRILRESIDNFSQDIDLDGLQKRAESNQSSDLTRVLSRLGAYQFVADRGWTLYSDSGVDASLRWVQKNYTFAQCTITNLTDTKPEQQLSIAGYQSDIQKSMGKQLGQMLEATEKVTATGLRMMRVVSIGTVNQVPMQWIHILASNDAGRHLSLVFTMNAASADRFNSQDLQIADTLEFTLRQLPTAPKEPSQKSEEKALEKPSETAVLKNPSSLLK